MTILAERDVSTPTTANAAAAPVFPALRPAYCLLAAPVAGALAIAGAAVAAMDEPLAVEIVRPGIVVLWAVAGLVLGVRRRHDRLAPIVLAGALIGAAGSLAATVDRAPVARRWRGPRLGSHASPQRRTVAGRGDAPAVRAV